MAAHAEVQDKLTRRSVAEVLDLALSFFGVQGLGLSMSDRTLDTVAFSQQGEWVCVTVGDGRRCRTVHVETSDWWPSAKIFLRFV